MDTLFQALVQNSSEAIVMLNADGSIRFASESSARLLGYALEERLGRSAFELMHPEDVAPARAAFTECLQRPGVPMPVGVPRPAQRRHVALHRIDRGEPARRPGG